MIQEYLVRKIFFFKGLIKDQSLREIIFLFARYPSKQDKIKTSKENNKHVTCAYNIAPSFTNFLFLNNFFFFFTVYQMVGCILFGENCTFLSLFNFNLYFIGIMNLLNLTNFLYEKNAFLFRFNQNSKSIIE